MLAYCVMQLTVLTDSTNSSDMNTTGFDNKTPILVNPLFETALRQVNSTIAILVFSVLNTCFSIASLYILLASKTSYKSRTFAFLKLFFVNELLFMTYSIPYTCWHLYNILMKRPELMLLRTCFYIVSPLYFLVRNSYTLTLLICLDRMLGFVAIAKNKMVVQPVTFQPLAPRFSLFILALLTINFGVFFGAFFDHYESRLIDVCSTKTMTGQYSALIQGILLVLRPG